MDNLLIALFLLAKKNMIWGKQMHPLKSMQSLTMYKGHLTI